MKSIFQRFLLALAVFGFSSVAAACPDGQYEVCTIVCYCVPDSGTVAKGVGTALNPLPDTITTVGGVVKGDVNLISQGIGGLVLKASCVGCSAAAQVYMSQPDRDFVARVIGRGYLVFLGTRDPTLVLVDALTSIPTQYALTREAPPIPVAAPPARGIKNYKNDTAVCAVLHEDKKTLVVGWPTGPLLTDTKSGTQSQYPNVDIREGDTLEFTSDDSCPSVPTGQARLKSGKLTYEYSKIVPALDPTVMKVFLIGQRLQ